MQRLNHDKKASLYTRIENEVIMKVKSISLTWMISISICLSFVPFLGSVG